MHTKQKNNASAMLCSQGSPTEHVLPPAAVPVHTEPAAGRHAEALNLPGQGWEDADLMIWIISFCRIGLTHTFRTPHYFAVALMVFCSFVFFFEQALIYSGNSWYISIAFSCRQLHPDLNKFGSTLSWRWSRASFRHCSIIAGEVHVSAEVQ